MTINKQRILFYIHYNKENNMSAYVLYQLEELHKIFDCIYFISNSNLGADRLHYLTDRGLIDEFLQRENKGFDFAAWGEAMQKVGFDKLKTYESVTVMNDSCIGPIYDFKPVFLSFEDSCSIDFWGITLHRGNPSFPAHIQSYYLTFNKRAVLNPFFEEYWSHIKIFDNEWDVIMNYEVKLTETFEQKGLKHGVIFDTQQEDISEMWDPNFSRFNVSEMLRRRIPFIKKIGLDYYVNQSFFLPVEYR